MLISRSLFNVLQLSIGMLCVFFAFISQAFIVETVLENRSKVDSRIDKHAGYYSQAMLYGTFIFGNIVAPPLVHLLTARYCLAIGGSAYTLYMAGFLFINPYYLYASALVEGFCAGLLWTSVGQYLALNSNSSTIARNSSIFWVIYMSSTVFGGVFLRIVFGNKADKDISMETTRVIYGSFAGLALTGTIVMLLLRKPVKDPEPSNYRNEMRKSLRLLNTVDMWLLAIPFAYSGIELSFWSGVYPTALSFTKQFSVNTNQMIAYNSICLGFGQLIGGAAFGVFGNKTNKFGRYPILWVGSVVSLVAYILIWINLPGNSSYEETYTTSIIQPSVLLGLICGGMLGFCDCCVNTQIYSFVSVRYEGQTSQAFASHKFFHAVFSCICMFYGSKFSLRVQLIILGVGTILSSLGFTLAEKRFNTRQNQHLQEKHREKEDVYSSD